MSLIPLSLLKSHLNLASDDVAEDALLAHKLAAAEQWVIAHVGFAAAGHPAFQEDPVLTEAALQLAASWYLQREAVTFGTTGAPVPFGVHDLLAGRREAVTGHVHVDP